MRLSEATIGQRVTLARIRNNEHRGKSGTVVKCIKSRTVVRVQIDGINPAYSYSTYDASPENIDAQEIPE